jgi:AraC family transcriptional regulator
MARAVIPAGRYAVFTHRGNAADVRQTVDAALSQWLPKSGKEHFKSARTAPDFLELYGPGFDPKTGLGDIEVWIPIKK